MLPSSRRLVCRGTGAWGAVGRQRRFVWASARGAQSSLNLKKKTRKKQNCRSGWWRRPTCPAWTSSAPATPTSGKGARVFMLLSPLFPADGSQGLYGGCFQAPLRRPPALRPRPAPARCCCCRLHMGGRLQMSTSVRHNAVHPVWGEDFRMVSKGACRGLLCSFWRASPLLETGTCPSTCPTVPQLQRLAIKN